MRKLLLLIGLAALAATAVLALAAPAPSATTVAVRDNVFRPETVTVRRGTTVTWRWQGRAPHNVVVTRGPQRFRSAVKTSGTYRRRLSRAGRYSILCTIHAPEMRMTVRVR